MSERREDDRAAEMLDEYLSKLQAGGAPDRDELLDAYPELESALDCIDVLEALAPPSQSIPNGDSGGFDPNETLDLPSGFGTMPVDFGHYELLGEIGRGGMGVVFKARQKDLDRTVAVKMILASHLASEEHVRRFHAEARAAAKMTHPNIVHIHEVGQQNGQHFFAMEYVEGKSLAQRIAEGTLDVKEAVRIIVDVARAVDHLHQQGIVHRDLKPSNILVDADNKPHVTDFGLAKMFSGGSELTATGVITGTPSYMAPEQAAGRSREVGPASDIYSLGSILYELLCGVPPFREENPLETLMQVMGREPTLPRHINPKVPRALELICLKCLSKKPDDRYASAGALADDLEHYARGEALEVRPPHMGQRLWRWTLRQPALALRLLALGVFYIVEMGNYLAGTIGWDFHWRISLLMGAWAAGSVFCQQFLNSRRWSIPARFLWGTLDSILLLAVLLVADGAASPLVVGYFLLIVGSGLWFRVRFVSFMTVLSLLSYGVLILDLFFRRPYLQEMIQGGVDRHVIFVVALTMTGAAVAYLVDRVRTLSAFCGRQLP